MKITALYVYPIKALRGIPLETARLGPLGIRYDRHFMLFKVEPDGQLKKLQLSSHPACALFSQRMSDSDAAAVIVRYHAPPPDSESEPEPESRSPATQRADLEVPLKPDMALLEPISINLHSSPASSSYRMGEPYDAWFSDCFGFDTILVYIGDGRRRVIGSAIPPTAAALQQDQQQEQKQQGWLSSLASYVITPSPVPSGPPPPAWLTFSDVAPILVTAESSLGNVQRRVSDPKGTVEMYKFRPNVVVDGEAEWEEDTWAELRIRDQHRLLVTGNCARCTSLNVDYRTGKTATGELGMVLKKLMTDRRVDKGVKWTPIFGRYAFLGGEEEVEVAVGDEAEVTKRRSEMSVWDWPGLAGSK